MTQFLKSLGARQRLILRLMASHTTVTIDDLATAASLTHSTARNIVESLSRRRFIIYDPPGSVTLTTKGKMAADAAILREASRLEIQVPTPTPTETPVQEVAQLFDPRGCPRMLVLVDDEWKSRGPLQTTDIQDHLAGTVVVGAYPGTRTRIVVVTIPGRTLDDSITAVRRATTWSDTIRSDLGVEPFVLYDHLSRGYHIWMVLSDYLPSADVARWVHTYANTHGLPTEGIGIYPTSGHASPTSMGRGIVIPMSRDHRRVRLADGLVIVVYNTRDDDIRHLGRDLRDATLDITHIQIRSTTPPAFDVDVQASPYPLIPNTSDWGARVYTPVAPDDIIQITARNGRTWDAIVGSVIRTDGPMSIVRTVDRALRDTIDSLRSALVDTIDLGQYRLSRTRAGIIDVAHMWLDTIWQVGSATDDDIIDSSQVTDIHGRRIPRRVAAREALHPYIYQSVSPQIGVRKARYTISPHACRTLTP